MKLITKLQHGQGDNMDYSRYEQLDCRKSGTVLTVCLNRPDSLNAINACLHTELSTLFADIAADQSVNAVVLTGAGRAFSAGGDLEWFRSITPQQVDELFVEARKIIIDLLELPQPIVAAINGAAAGLGATLALFCDVIYASENARISDPHVRVGVTAGDGGAVIWPLLVGPARAKEYLLTGDAVTAAEAERIGLINRVLSPEQLLPAATAMAERLASGPQKAIRSTKASVNKILRDTANLVLDTSLAFEKECFFSKEHKDAIQAFSDKR
jgi:enoyl-CoA hydratase